MSSKISVRQQYLLSLLAGAITVASFAPFGIWPLSILSLGLLFCLIIQSDRKRAFMNGFLFGLGLFGLGVSWVFNSIYEFGQAPIVFAIFLTLLFVLVLSLFPAGVGWASKYWSGQHLKRHLYVVLPCLWVLFEWLRGWLFTGFPWLQIGYGQISSPLSGIAPWFGVLGVSWLSAVAAGALAHLMVTRKAAIRDASICLVVVFMFGVLISFHDVTELEGEPHSVTLVQGNIAQEDKWTSEWLIPTVDRYVQQTQAHWSSDIVIWPEVALPGYFRQFSETVLKPVMLEAAATDTAIISGMLTTDGEVAWNSAVTLGADTQVYRKRHLVPFGEYLPLAGFFELFGDLVVLPAGTMRPGTNATLIETKGFKIATSICYEDAYGNEMADMLPAANVLLNVSNDGWFGDSLAPHQHLQIAQMRSLELGREMMRANNTGITAFIDHRGRLRDTAPQFTVTSITAEVQARTGRTFFVIWRNWGINCIAILLLLGVYLNRGK